MEVFKKRESVIQNIAYMAIMAAINILFVLLSSALPVLLFLLVLVLPLTSTIVTLYCKKKYYPIYAIATLGLCLAVAGGFSIFDTLIYVFPSLIVGFLFGIGFEYKVSAILILIGTTLAQFILSYLTFLVLTKIIVEFNVMDGLINLFGLKNFAYLKAFLLIFVYIVAQMQIVISYLFIRLQIKRIGIDVNLECQQRYLMYILTLITTILAVISYFYFSSWTLVFVIMPITIYAYEVIQLIMNRKVWIYISLTIGHILFIFLFAFLYKYVNAPNQLILLTTLNGLVTIIDFLCNYCFKQKLNNLK